MQHTFNVAQFTRIEQALSRRAETAIAIALTKTAKEIESAETDELARSIDRPTPFTMRAFGTDPARRGKLTARVFMRPIQSEYLRWEIEGGARDLKRFEIRYRGVTHRGYLVPGASMQLDQYGNVSKSAISRLLAALESNSPEYFVGHLRGRPNAPAGIYRRVGVGGGAKHLRLVFMFADNAPRYRQLVRWREVARGMFTASWQRNVHAAFASIR